MRGDEGTRENTSGSAPPPGAYSSGTYSIRKDPKQEALELFDKSLELLRRRDIDGAIDALRRAAQLEPDNRLVSTNLRRLEHLTTQSESAEHRGQSTAGTRSPS